VVEGVVRERADAVLAVAGQSSSQNVGRRWLGRPWERNK
jgi:hypothetical protein